MGTRDDANDSVTTVNNLRQIMRAYDKDINRKSAL
jgi:hypothetical protein